MRAFQDGVEVYDFRLDHLPAAEGQELARQTGGALAGPLDFLDVVSQRIVGRHAQQQQFRASHHHAEQVVEVVRDSAGQAPDGFHFLRLAQLIFELLLVGNILDSRKNTRYAADLDDLGGHQSENRIAFRGAKGHFHGPHGTPFPEEAEQPCAVRRIGPDVELQ